jgi:hypothetical protein
MLELLAADAAENGAAVIARVRKEKPHVWLQCMCALLPRQVQTQQLNPLADLTDGEIETLERMLAESKAKLINGAALAPADEPSEP